MAREGATQDPSAQQPDMERGLEAAARADGKKPEGQTNAALPEDAPENTDLKADQDRASELLRRNAAKDTGAS